MICHKGLLLRPFIYKTELTFPRQLIGNVGNQQISIGQQQYNLLLRVKNCPCEYQSKNVNSTLRKNFSFGFNDTSKKGLAAICFATASTFGMKERENIKPDISSCNPFFFFHHNRFGLDLIQWGRFCGCWTSSSESSTVTKTVTVLLGTFYKIPVQLLLRNKRINVQLGKWEKTSNQSHTRISNHVIFRPKNNVSVKVARYSFSGSIPPTFERKLRRQKQRFGKINTTVVLDKDETLL